MLFYILIIMLPLHYWAHCKCTAATDVLGYYHPQRNSWCDQECEEAAAAKDAAYKDSLQSVALRRSTRSIS